MARPLMERWLFAKRVIDENEGRWVKVSKQGHSSWPRHIAVGRIRVFRDGNYEAKIREGNGVTGTLYVRKVPQEETDA